MRFTPAFGYKDQYNVTVKEKDGVVVDTVKVFPGSVDFICSLIIIIQIMLYYWYSN